MNLSPNEVDIMIMALEFLTDAYPVDRTAEILLDKLRTIKEIFNDGELNGN